MRSIKQTLYRLNSQLRSGSHHSSRLLSLNAKNPAVALPVEILHVIFLCTKDFYVYDTSFIQTRLRYRFSPEWVAITYVCRRWRAITLEFRMLWSTITPGLSPKWISASLKRSSYGPKHVYIAVGPPSTNPPRKTWNPLSRIERRPVPVQQRLTVLPSEVTEDILSHVTRIENLQLKGNTADMIRTLKSLSGSMPLASLSLDFWDGYNYHYLNCGDDNERRDPYLILPESIFGGHAPRLRRLYFRSIPHVTFPPWVFRGISELTVSHIFCAKQFLSTLSQMPQLEALRVQGFSSPFRPGRVDMPVKLNSLALLVIEDWLPLQTFFDFLSCLLVPANLKSNLKLTLQQSVLNTDLWGRFTSFMHKNMEGPPYPLHGVHFRREPRIINIRAWAASPTEPGRSSSPWVPLDDLFGLEIRITGSNLPHSQHTDACDTTPFLQLQQLCTFLGGAGIQELFIEYQTVSHNPNQPMILCRCWQSLFSYFPSLKTLRFGDGAGSLLATASFAASVYPSNTADGHGILFENLQRVIVSQNKFSVEALWTWVYYACGRQGDVSDLGKNVSALLLASFRNPEVGIELGVTECLLMFILYCRRLDVQVFEFSLVEPLWDEPGGLEVLARLLYMLDPDWNVICYPSQPHRWTIRYC